MRGAFVVADVFDNDPGWKCLLKNYLKTLPEILHIKNKANLPNAIWVMNAGTSNLFHWLFDILQKLEFLENSAFEAIKPNFKVIMPNQRPQFMTETLKPFNLDYFMPEGGQLVKIEKMILLPNIAPTGNFRVDMVNKVRAKLKKHFSATLDPANVVKRVYITRKNAKFRKIINENDIFPMIIKNGFQVVDMDELPFGKQVEIMLNSEMLISLHGAGLSHMMWMIDGAKVMEVRARGDSHNNCYFSLASDLDFKYYYALADRVEPYKLTQISNFIIDKNEFAKNLKAMIGRRV